MALFDFSLVKTTAESVAKGMAERRSKADALRAQLLVLNASPVAKSEVEAAVLAWVDQTADGFGAGGVGAGVQAALWELARSPDQMRNASRYLSSALRLLPDQRSPEDSLDQRFNRLLCGLFRDQVKASLMTVVDGLDLANGLTIAGRKAEADRINAEITKLNDEIEQLRTQAQDAGLKLA